MLSTLSRTLFQMTFKIYTKIFQRKDCDILGKENISYFISKTASKRDCLSHTLFQVHTTVKNLR